MSLQRCHLWMGAAGLLLFVLTGQYMLRVIGVPELPDVERMLYRSNHIYLLLACSANIFAGYHLPSTAPSLLERLASILLLLALIILGWGFFTEPATGSLIRPLTRAGLYLMFAAPALLLLQAALKRLL